MSIADRIRSTAAHTPLQSFDLIVRNRQPSTVNNMTTRKPAKPNGFVIYRGPSLLDGQPIVAVALVASSNRKTGNMVQTYILRDGVDPVTAAREGQDASVCGDCKHRPANSGACYVTLIHGPSSVYRALQRGAYPLAWADDWAHLSHREAQVRGIARPGAGRMVRLGTYGDPAAVPVWIWQALVSTATGRTGYTHQWRNGDLDEDQQLRPLRALVMASADSEGERAYAQQMGWRTFRVRVPGEALGAREFTCPASDEAGKRLTCATCGACDGAQRGTAQASPSILVHGTKAGRFIAIRSA